jgi:uncharacterized protein YkwD
MSRRFAFVLLCTALGCGDAVATPIRAAAGDAATQHGRGSSGSADVPATEHCADVADWPERMVEAELMLFTALNELRAEGIRCGEGEAREREPLQLARELRCSARLHSLDMYENDYVGRENRARDDFRDRIRAAGIDAREVDEAIEKTEGGPRAVLVELLEDPDDCEALSDFRLNAVGIGHYADLWTLDFAEL